MQVRDKKAVLVVKEINGIKEKTVLGTGTIERMLGGQDPTHQRLWLIKT